MHLHHHETQPESKAHSDLPYKMFVYAEISKSMFKKVYSTTAIVIVQVLNLPYIEAIITQGQCLRRNIKLIKQTH